MKGRFTWGGLLLMIFAAPLVGLAAAWISNVGQSYFAPIFLFPILVGMFVGLCIVGLVRLAQVGHRTTAIFGGLLAAIVAVVGQHYIAYLLTYWAPSAIDPSAVPGRDLSPLLWKMAPTFTEYMSAQALRGRPLLHGYLAQGWAAWLTWSVDAILLMAAAVVVMAPALRVPYCNRCGTWYRTVRSGKIDLPTALRLAELIGVEEMDNPRSPRCRLSACQSGCGPTRCELSWEESPRSIAMVRVWLGTAGRNEVVTILDRVEGERQSTPDAGEAET